ncbi:Rho GTPase activation protein [Radiomyces spectabilis]|uniref:Rho GTPase activation protein n=1 Tax=Radiomyces spectabilis TaxID=64574 RepID=UPI00221F33F5|nr:Rho GTPase activation protein [Radiomyces spectabilis]KAI8384502.1 Rho GTPase activation protein [Radiomyces spectabilis]
MSKTLACQLSPSFFFLFIVERGVFGIPLVESIKYAHSSISYIDDDTGAQCFGVVPTIIAKCGSFLKEEGMAVEGIFRLSGSAKRTRMLQTMFDTPDSYGAELDWRGYTVHDAAAVMKRFLNHLPDPVITLEYYRPFKDTMKMSFPTPEAKIDAFQKLIQCLPIAHQYLLLYLLDMLSLFVTAEEYTRMGTQTLASIFAPGILSHPDDELNPAGYEESKHVLQYLIENQENFSIPRPATGQAHSPIAPPPQDLPLGKVSSRTFR